MVQLSPPYVTNGKTIALTRQTFVGKVMSLLFNMLSRLVITFLPRSKSLLISWLLSPSEVILEPKKIKLVIVSTVPPSICHEVMGLDAMILVFLMLSFKPTFPLSSFAFFKRLFSSSLVSAIRVMSSAYLRLLLFLPAITTAALEQPVAVRRYPMSKAKKEPQQDGKRGEFTFIIKPHSHQRCSEGSDKPCAHQDLGTPQRLRQNCV